MSAPLYIFGMEKKDIGIELLLSNRWDVEKNKSSKIDIIPDRGIIRKEKDRRLDKTIYEVYCTIFMSELLKQYNGIFRSRDFTLYSPQALRLEYGEKGKKDSLKSVIYEFFCPGLPLNKVKNPKNKEFLVDENEVRAGERVAYLSGILTGIFLREGVIHGDPHLRHFFLLPNDTKLEDIDRDAKITYFDSRNGLSVIDCENSRIEKAYSTEVKKDIEKYKNRFFKRFNCPRAQQYFDKGSNLVKVECNGFNAADVVHNIAKTIFNARFTKEVKDIDMKDMKIVYN